MFGRKKKKPKFEREQILNQWMPIEELIRLLELNDFEWGAYVMDKRGRKPRPSFSNNWPEGVRD